MSAAEDFEDTEIRDHFGLPPLAKITAAERAAVNAKMDTRVDNRRDYSINKPLPWLVLLALIAALALGLAISAFSEAVKAEREARMLEYYLLELDAKFINAGLKDPAESIANKLKAERERKQ